MGFRQKPDVEVTGDDYHSGMMNGLYHCREANQGPPKALLDTHKHAKGDVAEAEWKDKWYPVRIIKLNFNGSYRVSWTGESKQTDQFPGARLRSDKVREHWIRDTGGRQWYETDDGCYIKWSLRNKNWGCYDTAARRSYQVESDAATPPAAGWRTPGPLPCTGL